jgi:hypothetical protein
MWSIQQTEDGWEVRDASGNRIGDAHETYDQALSVIADLAREALAAQDQSTLAEGDGLLAETWEDVDGICFSEETGDGRDFTDCDWTWRDPTVSLLPLMLQTETEFGHFGAQLAGFMAEVSIDGAGTVHSSGRFYDTETGRQFRDMLLDGRRFGVSVDPGRAEADFECTEVDEDGFCVDGILRFTAYEVIGLTGTPFPAFERAAVQLAGAATSTDDEDTDEGEEETETDETTTEEEEETAASVTAAARVPAAVATLTVPSRPPADWFQNPGFAEATPLSIDDAGRVSGHLAAWGTCHVGSERICLVPPSTACSYERFLIGSVPTADGSTVSTGALTWGIEHADLSLSMIEAQAHYANSRHGWADVTVGEDDHGIWTAGALRPGLTHDDVRILRALALSGDWRHDARVRNLELVAALAVNVPGFPIPRAVVASGRTIEQPRPAAHVGNGSVQTALVASGLVIPSALATRRASTDCGCDDGDRLASIERTLARIDRRTRHLTVGEAAAFRRRLGLDDRALDDVDGAAGRLLARLDGR